MNFGDTKYRTIGCDKNLIITHFIGDDVKKVVLVPKKDFFEIWDNDTFLLRIRSLEEKLSKTTDEEKLEQYKEKVCVILSCGRRLVYRSTADKGRFISLRNEIVDRYHFDYSENDLVLEQMESYVRVWKRVKYESYQRELNNKKLLDKKLRERKK